MLYIKLCYNFVKKQYCNIYFHQLKYLPLNGHFKEWKIEGVLRIDRVCSKLKCYSTHILSCA